MITYVNTVLVGKGNGLFSGDINTLKYNTRKAFNDAIVTNDGKFVVEGVDDSKFRVGMITNKCTESYINGEHVYRPIIKWSNFIKKADIKSLNAMVYNEEAQAEDTITIDFTGVTPADLVGKRIVVRLTFKDLPTRYRKWTESYEYTVKPTDTTATMIADGIVGEISRNYKRARIDATASAGIITLVALPYDDDESVDSISPANKVRFSANMWMTDPQAAGFASKNKYSVDGAKIEKTVGISQVGEWKLVRDAESQAMGYQGILNRGECTWPIIKPEMYTQAGVNYDTITLEFENMYRTADDLFRKTKQTLQIFETNESGKMADVFAKVLEAAGIEDDMLPEINTDDAKTQGSKE